MVVDVILYILIGGGIFFALPSTVYAFMYLGVFYRHKGILLDKDDLKNTQYYPYREQLKKDILTLKDIPCEKVNITSKDGKLLIGRYYDNKSNKAIIFVHGYHANPFNNFSKIALDYINKGYNVLLIDQRAHGESGGKHITLGVKEKEDLLLWIDFVTAKEEVTDVIIYGISMGAATVGYASENIKSNKVKCLIMEAGFTCFYDLFNTNVRNFFGKNLALKYMRLTAKTFLKIDFKQSVESSLKNNKIPTLFLHGDNDKDVPIEFTKRNYTACASEKEMIIVKDAGHTLCYLVGGEPIHANINNFINKYVSK